MKCYRVFFNFRLSLRWLGPSTSPIHWSLSLASLVASVHDWNPRSCISLRWFCSGFLLDGFFFFYHLVSMRWLFLRARWCPFSVRGPTISTFFAGWHFAFFFKFAFRPTFSFVTLCGPYIFNILLRFHAWMFPASSRRFVHFPVSLPYRTLSNRMLI